MMPEYKIRNTSYMPASYSNKLHGIKRNATMTWTDLTIIIETDLDLVLSIHDPKDRHKACWTSI
jgi:hypothetical protein